MGGGGAPASLPARGEASPGACCCIHIRQSLEVGQTHHTKKGEVYKLPLEGGERRGPSLGGAASLRTCRSTQRVVSPAILHHPLVSVLRPTVAAFQAPAHKEQGYHNNNKNTLFE